MTNSAMATPKRDPALYNTRSDLRAPVEPSFEAIQKCLEDLRNQIRPMGLGMQAERVQSAILALGRLQSDIAG